MSKSVNSQWNTQMGWMVGLVILCCSHWEFPGNCLWPTLGDLAPSRGLHRHCTHMYTHNLSLFKEEMLNLLVKRKEKSIRSNKYLESTDTFFLIKSFISVCGCFVFMYVYVYLMSMEVREGIESPGTGVTDGWDLLCLCWESLGYPARAVSAPNLVQGPLGSWLTTLSYGSILSIRD